MFTLGDACGRAFGKYLDKSQVRMARRVVGLDDKALVNFASAAAKAADGSVAKDSPPSLGPCAPIR